ncbi:MAG TPA: VCBS repeat-containing protein [Pyrinomonadaceae bacterium]
MENEQSVKAHFTKQEFFGRSLPLSVLKLSALTIAVVSLFIVPLQARHATVQKSAAGTALVCVVSRNDSESPKANMDAVVMVTNGKLRQPFPEYNEAAQQKFGKNYFATGKNYRVTFGGGEVGDATVTGFDTGCNNIHAKANLKDNGKIPPHLSGLATDSDLLGRKPVARRAPTQPERHAVMKLVNRIYGSHQTARPLLRLITTTNLTATDLDGDGKFEMIGSFVIQTASKARRDLFLIAEPAGNEFKVGFEKFQAYRLPPEQFDSAIDFVDQLDLDGDGIAEVFVQQHGFDAYAYSIYKKTRGRWVQVFTTTGDAC